MELDKVYCGDCLEFMRGMKAGSIDAIITDLPYGTTACSWDEIIPFAPMWEQVKRVLKPRGVFVTTASQPFTSKLIMSNVDNFREEIIWEKERPSNMFLMHKKHGKTHENCIVFSESGDYTYNKQSFKNNKNRTREKMQRYAGNSLKYHDGKSVTSYRSDWDGSVSLPRSVVYFVRDVDKEAHPTQKPVALYEYLLKTFTNQGDTVLDFCCGSGTTGVAAIRTGRHYILVDSSEKYCKIAEKRIAGANVPLFVE